MTAYGNNENGCVPPAISPPPTTLRCDDPVDYTGGAKAPTVMSTYSLQTITSYVGSDITTPHPDYSYALSNNEGSYHGCQDTRTGTPAWCAGEHVLNGITPTVYQNGTGHARAEVTFHYVGENTTYTDTTQQVNSAPFGNSNSRYYLDGYHDHSSGTGETITYETAYNNTHGTPNTGTDNRYNPNYCDAHPTTCTGSFATPGDKAWTAQIVHTITTVGTDSSSSSLAPATTTYAYGLSAWSGTCPADSAGLTTCVGYQWYPGGESDWQDYYHGEFHGFSWVYITSPAGDLTAQNYASTEGWGTAEGYSGNYTSGQLYETDVYSGGIVDPNKLLSKTLNTYAGNNSTNASCYSDPSYTAYMPCEVILTTTRTINYEPDRNGQYQCPLGPAG